LTVNAYDPRWPYQRGMQPQFLTGVSWGT